MPLPQNLESVTTAIDTCHQQNETTGKTKTEELLGTWGSASPLLDFEATKYEF
jgi:hypothetical protein